MPLAVKERDFFLVDSEIKGCHEVRLGEKNVFAIANTVMTGVEKIPLHILKPTLTARGKEAYTHSYAPPTSISRRT